MIMISSKYKSFKITVSPFCLVTVNQWLTNINKYVTTDSENICRLFLHISSSVIGTSYYTKNDNLQQLLQ